MQNITIYDLTDEMMSLLDLLDDPESYNEDGELDPVIQEQLDLTAKEFDKKSSQFGYVLKKIDDDMEIIDNEIKRLQDIKKRRESSKKRIENMIVECMEKIDTKKIETPTIKLMITTAQSTDIYDFKNLPTQYQKTKIDILPDKTRIKSDLKKGIEIKGARLVETKHLRVR